MVEGKGGDESAEGGSVHDEKQRTKNGALGDATGASIEGWESVIASDTEGAGWQVGLKPVENRAMEAEPTTNYGYNAWQLQKQTKFSTLR